MLNANNERELAYLVRVDGIEPIVGSDNCEAALVGGWRVMVRKETFKVGELAIYFEIDSRVDTTRPEFEFLAKKNGKIKTQRYTFGGKGLMLSQGLLMSPHDFGWNYVYDDNAFIVGIDDGEGYHLLDEETRFLTKKLNVTYADAEDNTRKSNNDGSDKYKRMARRHPSVFRQPIIRWMMRYNWGRKLMFMFFGKERDKKGWPSWVVKTDEERCQNMPWILQDKSPWVATEKIDGTSTTFTMKRGKFGKNEFYVCSRNVVFDKPDKKCYYDTNVYLEMAAKYDIESKLNEFLKYNPKDDWVTLQGETYGGNIQKRNYSTDAHDFVGFNLITSSMGRWNSLDAKEYAEDIWDIPWVPIVDNEYILPDTIDELLEYANGKSVIDGEMREGIVFRSQDGQKSFKAVSNEFLLKYHQ